MSLLKKFNFTSDFFEGLTIVCVVVDTEHENLVIHAHDGDRNKLILWDMYNDVLLKTKSFPGDVHVGNVSQAFKSLMLKDGKLFVSYNHTEIIVYALSENDIRHLGVLKLVDSPYDIVNSMACYGDTLISAHAGINVAVWDINNFKLKYDEVLIDSNPDLEKMILEVDFDGEHVVLSNVYRGFEANNNADLRGFELQIFNVNDPDNITNIDIGPNIGDFIYGVRIFEDKILTVHRNNQLSYWTKSLEPIRTVALERVLGTENVIILKKFIIADTNSGSFDSDNVVNIFSLEDDGEHVETIDNRNYMCLTSDDNEILVASGGEPGGMQNADVFLVSDAMFDSEKYVQKILNELKDPSVELKTIDTRNIAKYIKFAYLSQELKEKLKDDDDGEYVCPIIGSTIENDTMIAVSDCNHVMSREGFDKWLDTGSKTCPICRQATDYLTKITRRDRVIEKILNEWEKKLNKARDEFLNFTKVGMTSTEILNYAKQHKDDIVMQNFENKGTVAAMEVFKWQLLVETNNQQSGSMVLTGANLKNLPPIRIVRPNI
jgi:hypothetical protein